MYWHVYLSFTLKKKQYVVKIKKNVNTYKFKDIVQFTTLHFTITLLFYSVILCGWSQGQQLVLNYKWHLLDIYKWISCFLFIYIWQFGYWAVMTGKVICQGYTTFLHQFKNHTWFNNIIVFLCYGYFLCISLGLNL